MAGYTYTIRISPTGSAHVSSNPGKTNTGDLFKTPTDHVDLTVSFGTGGVPVANSADVYVAIRNNDNGGSESTHTDTLTAAQQGDAVEYNG